MICLFSEGDVDEKGLSISEVGVSAWVSRRFEWSVRGVVRDRGG